MNREIGAPRGWPTACDDRMMQAPARRQRGRRRVLSL